MTDIKVCDDKTDTVSGDIVVCDETQTPEPGDIKVCEDDGRLEPNICGTVTTVPVVSGDSDCNVGDIYTATGGTGVYTWSFDGGSISSNGEILTINACVTPGDSRVGVVTAFDGCSSGGLVVRLSGGVWLGGTPVAGTITWTCTSSNCCAGRIATSTQIEAIGGTQWVEQWRSLIGSCSCPPEPFQKACTDYTMTLTAHTIDPFMPGFIQTQTENKWVCP